VALAPGGGLAVSGHGDGRIRYWEIGESPTRAFFDHPSQAATFTRGRVLALPSTLVEFRAGLAERRTTPVGPSEITALATRVGSRSFAIGREDGTVELWDRDGRRPVVRWTGHNGPVVALAGSPDGGRLASASAEGPLKIWAWETGQLERAIDAGEGEWQALAWRREGSTLAAAGAAGVMAWDLQAGPSAPPRRLVDQPQLGQLLAFGRDCLAHIGTDGTVEIRDDRTGALLRTLPDREAKISALAFAPDGRTLAVGRVGSPIRIWDAGHGVKRTELTQLRRAPYTDFLDFSPDGHWLVATVNGPGSVQVWDMDSYRLLGEEVETQVAQARFLTDGSALVQSVPGGSVSVCLTEEFGRAAGDARRAATGGGVDGHTIFRASETVAYGRETAGVWGIAASPDGRWLATAAHDGAVTLWDAATGQRARSLTAHPSVAWSVAFSPDSRLVASAGDVIIVCDVATGREVSRYEGHERMISSLAFHPTRPWLISGGYDGTVRVWDREKGEALGVLHRGNGNVNGVAIRLDGRWAAAASADGRVRAWDLDRPLAFPSPPDRVVNGLEGALWSVGFDPSGRTLATGAEHGAIILWDAPSFQRLTTLRGGSGQLRQVSFSADGALLAGSAYLAPTVVWDLAGVRETLRAIDLDWRP
jgi:WD40 repeat protein